VRAQPSSPAGTELAGRIRSILSTRNLNLHAVSQNSEAVFGHASPFVLPHNLYYELRTQAFSPSLHQLFALSRLTNYRLADWGHVFGLDLEQIPRLQILLPNKRTVLLDSSLSDPESSVQWFQEKTIETAVPPVAPLSQLLKAGPMVRQRALIKSNGKTFLYAKVGSEDAMAFPDLLPGSIVRIAADGGALSSQQIQASTNQIFLVEHAAGIRCCRLLHNRRNRILLVSTHLPYAQVELELHREAKVLGPVDLEVRPLVRFVAPEIPAELERRWKPEPLPGRVMRFSQFLRAARMKMALSLREASRLGERIAAELEDERYFMSASALSDYEAGDSIPGPFQNLTPLCVVYGIGFRRFLEVAGIPERGAGKDSIPDSLLPRSEQLETSIDSVQIQEQRGVVAELLRRMDEFPLFLKGSIATLTGLKSPSMGSIFWVGGIKTPMHPYLANALLVSVDRHKKRPIDSRSRPPWEQLIYVLLKRDGTYVVGPCGQENGALVMHPDRKYLKLQEEFRNRRDAELVGQVRAIIRKL
jgi:transcriptional regulator with XRE-family HTH domain